MFDAFQDVPYSDVLEGSRVLPKMTHGVIYICGDTVVSKASKPDIASGIHNCQIMYDNLYGNKCALAFEHVFSMCAYM